MITKKETYKGEVNAPCLSYDWFYVFGIRNHWDSFADLPTTPFYCYRWPALLKVPNALKLALPNQALSNLCSGLPRDQIDCQRTEEMDPSSDLHSDGHFHLSGTDYLGEACFRGFDDFITYYLLKVIPNNRILQKNILSKIGEIRP